MKDFRNSPIIKAQEICKETVVKIANEVIPMYQSAVEDLTINDYEVDMKPWNNGYVLTIKPLFDYSTKKEEISVYHLKSVSPSVDGSQSQIGKTSTEKSKSMLKR